MFSRLPQADAHAVEVTVDGRAVTALAGDSVAAALLSAGVVAFRRSAISRAPRGPFCMMGACFECLVEIDGEPNRQACLTRVRPGMRVVTRVASKPDAE